jgi:hypothetical protein
MPILHAIVLGITQGLSEFLPISSSGHLILVPWLFGWHDFAGSKSLEKSFDAILHLGTFLAAVAYFRHELVVYIRDGLKAAFNRRVRATPDGRLAWLILLSALPAALVGAAGEKAVEDHTGKIPLIAIMLIVFGLVLAWADRLGGRRELHDFSHTMARVQPRQCGPHLVPHEHPRHGRGGRLQAGQGAERRHLVEFPGRAHRRTDRRHGVGILCGVGPPEVGAHAQLHAVRDLPRDRRHRRAHPGRDGVELSTSTTAP